MSYLQISYCAAFWFLPGLFKESKLGAKQVFLLLSFPPALTSFLTVIWHEFIEVSKKFRYK